MALCVHLMHVCHVLGALVLVTHLVSHQDVGKKKGETYAFPHHIIPTSLRPDIVWWSEEEKILQMLELTISHKSVMEQARQVKQAKYQDLIDEVMRAGYRASLITLEVGSRGLIVESELMELNDALNVTKSDIVQLGMTLSRCTNPGSFKIGCTQNLSQ